MERFFVWISMRAMQVIAHMEGAVELGRHQIGSYSQIGLDAGSTFI